MSPDLETVVYLVAIGSSPCGPALESGKAGSSHFCCSWHAEGGLCVCSVMNPKSFPNTAKSVRRNESLCCISFMSIFTTFCSHLVE